MKHATAITPAAAFSRQRRQWLAAAALAALLPTARAAPATLPEAAALSDELARALRRREPLVVMVSLDGCPFCETARNHYLAPLRAEGGLEIVQVNMRSARALRDLQGQPLTHDQMVRRWGVKIAPTVLFLGPGGAEVAERLVGAGLPDFYGAYLDGRLEVARRATRG